MSDPYGEAIFGLGERLNRLSRRMVPGGLGGRTDLASPRVALAGIVPPVTAGEEDVAGGPQIAHFHNNGSPFLTGGYHDFNTAYSNESAPGWFEWPVGGTDRTSVRILEPGIYTFLAYSDGSGGSGHDLAIEVGIFGTVGANRDTSSGTSKVSACGGTDVYPSAIDPSGTDVDVRLLASGPTNASGSLTIVRYASPYYISFSGNGFTWEEVTY